MRERDLVLVTVFYTSHFKIISLYCRDDMDAGNCHAGIMQRRSSKISNPAELGTSPVDRAVLLL